MVRNCLNEGVEVYMVSYVRGVSFNAMLNFHELNKALGFKCVVMLVAVERVRKYRA